MSRRTPRPALVATCAAALLTLTGVAACSAGGSSDSGAATSLNEQGAPAEGATGDVAGGSGPQSGQATREGVASGGITAVDPAVAATKVVRRAELGVRVDDVETAATEVRRVAAEQGGVVRSENITSDGADPTPRPVEPGDEPAVARVADGTIVVAVPAEHLDATLDRLARVGEVVARTVMTDDVTARYADTDSRVDSARASVARIRALMSEATKLGDVVTLEAELSRRQADLEALESQLAALDGQIALSPVTVHLSTTTPPPSTDETGFLAGLAAGWRAFTASVTVLLTVLGALVPFAVVAAVVLVPALVWWRRRGGRAAAVPGPASAPPAP